MLTAGDAQQHIRHTLGHDMSSEVSHMDVVNQAGRFLCSMHSWRWLKKRPATVHLEAGLPFIRLPRDLASLSAVRGATSLSWGTVLMGADSVHALRLDGSQDYPWAGTVLRRTLPAQNLLAYSTAPSNAPWAYTSGTGTITPNAAISPFTQGTSVASVSDSDVTAVSTLTQKVYPHLLADGTKYTATAILRPDPITTTTPPKSALWVCSEDPATNGIQTMLEIQWGQTPWQDPPTLTVIGTNGGGGVALAAVPWGEGYWQVSISGYTHQHNENYGRLLVSIQPTRAAWADASGTEDVAQIGVVDLAYVGLNEGMLPFDREETSSTISVPRRLEPVLEVSPTPTTTTLDALSILYRAGWVDAEDDDDDLSLPAEGWLDTLYLQIVRAFTRGWEEDDVATLDERLAQILTGPIAQEAKNHDSLIQPNRGQPKNTAMQTSRGYRVTPPFPVSITNVTPV